MKNINEAKKGWFIGNFIPTIYSTKDFEVGIKKYKSGDREGKHVHKIGTEYTVVINGEIEMNGENYKEGDIVVVVPNQASEFRAITDTSLVIVKIPSLPSDKYEVL